MAWACGATVQPHVPLLRKMASAAQQLLTEFTVREIATTARAFATAKQSDQRLFVALARAAARRAHELQSQDFAGIAWALALANRCRGNIVLKPLSPTCSS
eukprot:gnl/TRDRNA2_/TRDRNA2_174497_c11_seq2.p3 gnl/TRDRNA2_/TRDRNA2_174497_c11~~gnl/TRDRNA2_/TRDRNA2_174497_c11_seq2.p3  ORF type:complete len:101 (+),score=11.09 gnl/TRDRNA2_/TRDRNA2_174497_c11_seq2:215-517(+)